jgi:hypothetical protein
VAEPTSRDPLEARAVEGVDALAPAALGAHQAGELELTEVTARRGPGAVEAPSDLARGHLAAVEVKGQQDLTA